MTSREKEHAMTGKRFLAANAKTPGEKTLSMR